MSRQSTVPQRDLTLTEELEKLEQSITLTLQEIDYNFSRAHRIVTSSILPIVENYRENSNKVWEGSKFWKQFFEASANVSLSGYEEPPLEGEDDDEITTTSASASAQTTPSTSTYASPPPTQDEEDVTITPMRDQTYNTAAADFSPSPSQSTPRPQPRSARTKPGAKTGRPATTAPYSSPYENLKKETFGQKSSTSPSESTLPSTPRGERSPDKGAYADPSSPFVPPSTRQRTSQRTPANDVLLHRVLDKNWRIQATPHSTARGLSQRGQTTFNLDEQQTPRPSPARKTQRNQRNHAVQDDDLDSSPAAPAPELHAEIFGTPARKGRVPGVSVLTPAKGLGTESAAPGTNNTYHDDLWDSDDDIDAGISPPKTMQFHVPQSRLVRTPAREASKRIVEDLLSTAGMGDGMDEAEEEDSPSIVKRGGLLEEDTF